jgi:hypothetical protein
LSSGGGHNNVRVVVQEELPNCRTKQFGIAIRPKTPSVQASVSPKEAKHQEDRGAQQILQPKNSIVASGTIDKDKGLAKPPWSNTITKGNIDLSQMLRLTYWL